MLLLFFFFQAEDGIRDYKVTGVQTYALPICRRAGPAGLLGARRATRGPGRVADRRVLLRAGPGRPCRRTPRGRAVPDVPGGGRVHDAVDAVPARGGGRARGPHPTGGVP